MSTYHYIWRGPHSGRSITEFCVCDECGAIVDDTQAHHEFHERLSSIVPADFPPPDPKARHYCVPEPS